MSPWLAAILGLLAPFGIAVWFTLRGSLPDRLVATQLATILATLIMVLMGFAFSQPSILDLALALVFLSLPGSLLLAIFTERWL